MSDLTYDQLESSRDAGRPIEFYRFILGSLTWYYSTAEYPITVAGIDWVPAAIVSEAINQTGEYARDALKIECPSSIAPAQLFMTAAPSKFVDVAIGYKHVDSDEIVIGYMGQVRQCGFPVPGRARLLCESLSSTFSREGLRLGWQRSCPYALYDPLTCKVDKSLWKIDCTVLNIDGFTLQVDLADPKTTGYFDGGFIEWIHPIRGTEFLWIETHTVVTAAEANGTFVISGDPGELFEGAVASAYPGCDFTPAACQAFNNYDNYGGVPDMPGKSPFDGDPVF